jgi:hypothetical protein
VRRGNESGLLWWLWAASRHGTGAPCHESRPRAARAVAGAGYGRGGSLASRGVRRGLLPRRDGGGLVSGRVGGVVWLGSELRWCMEEWIGLSPLGAEVAASLAFSFSRVPPAALAHVSSAGKNIRWKLSSHKKW